MLNKSLVAFAVLASMGMGAVSYAQPPRFRFQKNPEERHKLQVGKVNMEIDAANGARIVSLKYGDTEVLSQINFPNQYGSTFWTSPQKEWNWPPVFEHDMAPYTVRQEGEAIVMTSPLSEKLPLRIVKRFEVDAKNQGFLVTYTLKNESAAPRKVAPWEITRVLAKGSIFFDADVQKITPAGEMNFRCNGAGLAQYDIDHVEGKNRKINADGKGWLSYVNNNLVLTKRFQDLTPEQPAPNEAEIQVYVHQGDAYVELESQGAYTELQPGDSLLWQVQWSLYPTDERAGEYIYPYRNPDLKTEERVENLLQMLTPEEKVGLMMNKSISVDRLDIPSYNWWSEACHGVRQGGYTVYPQPIGMASAFNAQLVHDVFSTVSDEARANWNRSDHNIYNVPMGVTYYPGNPELTFWCPNVNIFRDPRWGRGQETCGEDPYLSAILGVETVKGMQGNDPHYFKTHACAKHYAVHSGPEPLRHSYDARVSMRDLWETYLPAFKALVQKGNVREVMCAYNRYEGKPCCMSDRLLIQILRQKWGFDAIVLTDCDAINNFYNKGQHETHPDPLSASVDAVMNGTDLECGKVFMVLTEALKQGLIEEKVLDEHLRKTLTGRFELGMFDPADRLPWANLGEEVISSESNHRLSVEAARQSMVLLKNDKYRKADGTLSNTPLLPLSKQLKTIAVVGPNADDVELLNGNYGGTPTRAHQHSLLEGIRKAVPGAKVIYNKACELQDEYETRYLLPLFNDGKGMKVEFYENRQREGEPVKVAYMDKLQFSTFGAWGFSDGVKSDSVALRVSGTWKADFTGALSYTLNTDNGYRLLINGQVVEENQGGGRRRGFGFGRVPEYKTLEVKEGEQYDIVVEYGRGQGHFAMFNGDFCRRKLNEFQQVVADVKEADVIIVIGGISARMEGEGGDKKDIDLPVVQQRLLRAMRATGKPVVMVNCSGSAIAFGNLEKEYDALLQAWYLGEGGSEALPEVLFGDYNPSGKLPVTFYASNDQLPDFLDYSMENRTYRYFAGEPLYAFGYGLSYTSFEYGKAKLSAKKMARDGKLTVTIPVTNSGKVTGDEIVQVYIRSLDNETAPIKELKGFQRLHLNAGEKQSAVIELTGESFQYYDEAIDELSTRAGKYQILYGPSSRAQDLRLAGEIVVK